MLCLVGSQDLNDLRGKRLLLLSGGMWKEAIKQYADEEGIVLLATGNDASSGIFSIAEEGFLVDSTDSSAMKELISAKRVDGVYMGGCEPVIASACEYLPEVGLPCYCSKAQWESLQNKVKFKEVLASYGLPVAPRYDLDENTLETLPDEAFPVITKPADAAGSSGFSVCRDVNELYRGFSIAKQASSSGTVLIEKMVNNKSIVVYYAIDNGEPVFCGLEDKFPVHYEEQGSYVAGLHIFGSRLESEFRDRFEDRLKDMFRGLGLKAGTLWIEVFHDGGEYFFNEAGYRYSGSMSMFPVDYYAGINQVAFDMHYSLCGQSDLFAGNSLISESIPKSLRYAIYPVHMLPGTIASISGLDDLLNSEDIVTIPLTKSVGQTVSQTGTVDQVFAFVHFVFDCYESLLSAVENIHKTLSVKDAEGRELLVQKLNVQSTDIQERL